MPEPPPSMPFTHPLTPGSRESMERAGDFIGPYRLLEVIGEGGFGIVWLAERREPMVQRVALKIIKPGMDTRAVIARFEQERQALALMDHPGVARVYDAGMTPAGRPYFVMEHVKGEPITEFCDRHNLSLRQRLELFIPVCDAVQHAHMRGLIHRDLKPSNILVSMTDVGGRSEEAGRAPREPEAGAHAAGGTLVKVIDFGVAKAISKNLSDKTIFTESGQVIGTPEYMSPEQAEMGAADIDTRSDVYSLGVVLYELLTSVLPFDSEEVRKGGLNAFQRMIREVDPPKPSTRLTSLTRAARSAGAAPGTPRSEVVPADIARHRRVHVDELVRELRRELEWIPLKAMRKDRRERYRTPAELADDVRRYLDGRPLEAGPESSAYRARKFIRRHRGPVIAAAALFAVLVAGVIGTTAGYISAARRAAAEERARLEAQAARKRAETITEFVTTSLKSGDPSNAGGRQNMTVLQAMDNALKDINAGRFKGDPDTEAGLLDTIATVVMNNGRADEALPKFERALEIRTRVHPGDHRDVAASQASVGVCLDALGRSTDALPRLNEALAMRRRLFPADHPDVADSLTSIGACLSTLGRAEDALASYRSALEMYRRLFPGDRAEIAAALNNVGNTLVALGQAEDALPEFQSALEMDQRLFPGDHPGVATSLNNVANCLVSLGRADEALARFEDSLSMRRRLYPGNHPEVAASLYNLAACLHILGRAEDALPRHEEALTMRRALFPGDHPDVARSLSSTGNCLNSLKRRDEALPLYTEALAMRRRLFSGDHPDVSASLNNVAFCLDGMGRSAEALPLFESALEMSRRLFPGDHPSVAIAYRNLARCLAALDRAPEALALAQQGADMAARVLPDGHPMRRAIEATLADVQGKVAAVEPADTK